MGVVFAAYDNERRVEVALKILHRLDAAGILQLKREFRSLAEVSHPNLVSLYELGSSGGIWSLTMELIDGVDFLSWVRDQPGSASPITAKPRADEITTLRSMPALAMPALDPAVLMNTAPIAGHEAEIVEARRAIQTNVARLRAALRQLVQAVHAVHAAGKLHRDIKPSNMLVTGDGRVVLLDFGLVSDGRAPDGATAFDSNGICGTPEYMAPEQASGLPATASSDWYAVGTVLYEALSGRLPFETTFPNIIGQKVGREAPDLRPLVTGGAVDLAELAMRLLARDPARRPSGVEVLRAVGADEGRPLIASSMSFEDQGPFVGRRSQLHTLSEALRISLTGRAAVVTVRGASGIGKSSLCRRFLADVRAEVPRALVLKGRCYERESVPYKALDGLVDHLVAELAASAPEEQVETAPRDREALTRLFPALRRAWPSVPPPELAGAAQADDADGATPRALRRRAVAALRDLLSRQAARRPVVALIDDFQWSDIDSLQILIELVRGDDSPAILWVLSFRSEDEERSEPLRELQRILADPTQSAEVRRIDLEALPPADCRTLALQLLGRDETDGGEQAERLARESAGSPIFIAELVRLEMEGRRVATPDADVPATLEEMLRARVTALPATARRLLSCVAVAGRPTRQRILQAATGLDARELTALLALRNGNLIRATGLRDDDFVEAYHDRIRELVVSTLSPDELRYSHADLAGALQFGAEIESLPTSDLEAIAYHSLGAGDDVGALGFTLRVARAAQAVYASRDAVRHYEMALAIAERTGDADTLSSVRRDTAQACRQAGLYDRAVTLFTAALDASAEHALRAEILVDRGRVFQEKGEFQAAIADLESSLGLFGRRSPRGRLNLAAATTREIAHHLVGAIRPGRLSGRDEGGASGTPLPRDAAFERQAEILLILVRIYYFVDIGKLVWAGFAAMNLARRSRRDVTRSLASGYFGALLSGVGWLKPASRHCDEALALAERSGDPLAKGVALARLGTLALFRNQLGPATDLLRRSVIALKGVSEVWELLTGLMLEATGYFLAGLLDSAEQRWDEMALLSRDAGGAMHYAWSLAWNPYVRYLRGTIGASEARRGLEEAVALSRSVRDIANQTAAQSHLAAICVQEGDAVTAALAADQLFATLWSYRVQVPFLQVGLVDAAEAALLALGEGVGDRGRLRTILRRSLSRLERGARSYSILVGPTLRVRAKALAWGGRRSEARQVILKAVRILEEAPNRLWLLQAYRDAARLHPERANEFVVKCDALAAKIGSALAGAAALPFPSTELRASCA